MARLLRLAKHHGVQPDHIDFSIQIHSLELSTNMEDRVQVIISRGSKAWPGAVVSSVSKDGHWQFLWNSPIQITSSMFPSKKGPRKYDVKAAKIIFKRITKNSAKTFGEIELDLSEFCEAEHNNRLQRPLHKCSDKYAQVDFTITSLISQRDVSPSMIDDESMALTPEQSQIENEAVYSSQSLASVQQAFTRQENGSNLASKKPEEQPNSNDGSKQSTQSVQLLIALKDDSISRLRKKVDELELINKSAMGLVNRVNELEEQLNSKTKAYDQLKLNSLMMEKLLADANAKVEDLVKDSDSDDENVKDALTENIGPAPSNDELLKLSQEKEQLLAEIANSKLDMASLEESYRKEVGDLKSELNQARNERNDASNKLNEIQKSSKESELMEALELEKVSCESLRGIIRLLQEKSTEQESMLVKLHESSEQEISKMKEKLLQLEQEKEAASQDAKLLKCENTSIKNSLEQSEVAAKQLLSETDELKRSVLVETQNLERAKEEFKSNLDSLTSSNKTDADRALTEERRRFALKVEELSSQIRTNNAVIGNLRQSIVHLEHKLSEAEETIRNNASNSERQMAIVRDVSESYHQSESTLKQLIAFQSSSSGLQDQFALIEKLMSEATSVDIKRRDTELNQNELIQRLTEKIQDQSNALSICERYRYESLKAYKAKMSTMMAEHLSQIDSLNNRIAEYQQIINLSNNNDLGEINALNNQVASLKQQIINDRHSIISSLGSASSSAQELSHDICELVHSFYTRDYLPSENTTIVTEATNDAFFVISCLQANNEALQRLLNIETERSVMHRDRLQRKMGSMRDEVEHLEAKVYEGYKEGQRLESEVDKFRNQYDEAQSIIRTLQQKVDLMEKSALADQAKFNQVMAKYEKACIERDHIIRDFIGQQMEYSDLYDLHVHKLSLSAASLQTETQIEDTSLIIYLDDFNSRHDRIKNELDTIRCGLNNTLGAFLANHHQLASRKTELEKLTSFLDSELKRVNGETTSSQSALQSTENLLHEERDSSKHAQMRIQQLEQTTASQAAVLFKSTALLHLYDHERERFVQTIESLEADVAELSTCLIGREAVLSSNLQTKELERWQIVDQLDAISEQQHRHDWNLTGLMGVCSNENRQLRHDIKMQQNRNQRHVDELYQSLITSQKEKVDSEKQSNNVIMHLESDIEHLKEELAQSQQHTTDNIDSMKARTQLDMNKIAELQCELQRLNEETDARVARYESSIASNAEELRQKFENFEKSTFELKVTLKAKEDLLDELQGELDDQQKEINQIQSELLEERSRGVRLQEEYQNKIRLQSGEWTAKTQEYENLINGLRAALLENECLMRQLQTDLGDLKMDIERDRSCMVKLQEDRDATIAQYECRLRLQSEEWTTKSQNREHSLSVLRTALRDNEVFVEKLQNDQTSQDEKIKNYEMSITGLKTTLEQKDQFVEKLQSNLMKQNEILDQMKDEIEKRISHQVESEKQHLEAKQRFEKLLEQYEEIKRSKEEQDRRIAHYEQQELDRRSSKSDQLTELSKARSTIQQLESQLDDLRSNDNQDMLVTKQKISELEQELLVSQQSLQDQIQELKSAHQSSEEELHKARSIISVLEEELQNWKQQRQEQNREVQAVEETLTRARYPDAVQAEQVAPCSDDGKSLRHLISEKDQEIERLRMSFEDIQKLNKHLEERLVNTNVRMSQMQDEENQLEEQIKTLEAVLDDVVKQKTMQVKKK